MYKLYKIIIILLYKMYYYYNCNNFSREYLQFKNYRFCIENILKLNIHFKNLNELNEEDILIIFSFDVFNDHDILNELLNYKFKIFLINTENFKFDRIIKLFQQINNKNNIYLIEYNIVNIHYIKSNFNNINYYFIPLLYNPYLESVYNEKYITFNQRKNDILFCGSPGSRRKNILNKLTQKFNIKQVHHALNIHEQNLELANSKIILNIYSYEHNKIFDYYRNSYLLANKCLLISEYPENIDLTIEKNLIGYEENLIFFKNDEDCEKVLEKYLNLSDSEYQDIVNKQYNWFKSQNNMIDYAKVIFT